MSAIGTTPLLSAQEKKDLKDAMLQFVLAQLAPVPEKSKGLMSRKEGEELAILPQVLALLLN